MKLIAWLLSLIFAFSLGAETAAPSRETDDELRTKIQDHIDVIVDEGAAILDDVSEEIRQDERVQEAEQFIQDVKDVTEESLDGLKDWTKETKDRVEDTFGSGRKTDEAETDEVETDEVETDEAKTDEAETDEAETDEAGPALMAPPADSEVFYQITPSPDDAVNG